MTKSLEFTQKELHDGLVNVKNDIKKVQTDLREIEDDLLDPTFVMQKLTELEDRSRRNNVRIEDIPEISNETWKSCEEEVRKIIKNKLDMTDDIEVDCYHRMSKFQRKKLKPRTVVCKFLRSKNKPKLLQNAKKLKDTRIFIYEDLSKATIENYRNNLNNNLTSNNSNYRSIVVKDHLVR